VVYLAPEITSTADGSVVLSGRVELYYQATWRLLAIELPDERSILFKLSLPADPTLAAQHRLWSPWKLSDQVVLPGQATSTPVNSQSEAFLARYRVEFWLEPQA
jgi:hypothetical protein